jgi:hypothetical protein
MNYFTKGVVGVTTGTLSVLSFKSPQVYPTINPPAYTASTLEVQDLPHSEQEQYSAMINPEGKAYSYGIKYLRKFTANEIPRTVGLTSECVVFIDPREFLPSKSGS